MKTRKTIRGMVAPALIGAGVMMSGGILNTAAASNALTALENATRLPYARESAMQVAQCKGCAGKKACCGAKKGCCGAKKACCGAKKGCCGAKKQECGGAKKGCCGAKPKSL